MSRFIPVSLILIISLVAIAAAANTVPTNSPPGTKLDGNSLKVDYPDIGGYFAQFYVDTAPNALDTITFGNCTNYNGGKMHDGPDIGYHAICIARRTWTGSIVPTGFYTITYQRRGGAASVGWIEVSNAPGEAIDCVTHENDAPLVDSYTVHVVLQQCVDGVTPLQELPRFRRKLFLPLVTR